MLIDDIVVKDKAHFKGLTLRSIRNGGVVGYRACEFEEVIEKHNV